MNINSNGYVLGFAVGVCVVMSSMLALASSALRDAQRAAEEFDRQKNVMVAARLIDADGRRPGAERAATRSELEDLYSRQVEEKVLVLETGEFDPELKPADYPRMKPEEQKRYRVVALAHDSAGKTDAIVLPISGKGLWSIIYGYLALEPDGKSVKGVTFYKHGETPGLGGECENPEWTAKWVGKKLLGGNGELIGISIKKGKVDPAIPMEKEHMVDGLSGATITGRGITRFLKSDLEGYRPYLSRIWGKD
ncbi:MAG: Na(+)-translocating NADH-quinone reductase subunit C [Planctomycetota bacterium]